MKRLLFSGLAVLCLALNPLFAFCWSDSSPRAIIGTGDDAVILSADLPYYQAGTAVEYCDLVTDDTCTAYLEADYWFPILRLNNYLGDSIAVSGELVESVSVFLAGDNQITTTNEYGLQTAAKYLYLQNSQPETGAASLIVNLDSPTTRANGIINQTGDINIEDYVNLELHIRSALPATENSSDEVTGLTTPADKNVVMYMSSNLLIDNPTGSFGIYTGHFYASQENIGVENYGYHPFTTITHKINDGFGDAFLNNDFEESTWVNDPYIVATQPEYTFRHEKTDTLGTFAFLAAAQGYNANYDDTLTEGENFADAETRIVDSLAKETSPSAYTELACYYEPAGMCPYNPEFFDIVKENSALVIVDDLHAGLYHDNTLTEISAAETYALKIFFQIVNPEVFGFSKIDYIGPVATGLLNHDETLRYANGPARTYLSPSEIYVLAPLTVTPKPVIAIPDPEPEPEPEPEEPEPEEEPKVEEVEPTEELETIEINEIKIILPKAPNTGIVL